MGLVLELQADALNRQVHVTDLLRKALVVSKKLGISQIEEWISNELNGYRENSEVPPYREIHGEIKVWNPYHGWQPLNFSNVEMAEALSKRKTMQPVSELDSLIDRRNDTPLQMPFPQHIVNSLMNAMDVPLQPTLQVSPTEIIGILDAVRNNILNWALQLEQEGILGDGMSFSKEEKRAASKITYQITNNIGSMHNSQIQQDSPAATQSLSFSNNLDQIKILIEAIKSSMDRLGLADEQSHELSSELATIESQVSSPKPKRVILSESLRSVRTILEGTAGNLLASNFLSQVSAILQTIT